MRLMRPKDYPEQEPVSAFAQPIPTICSAASTSTPGRTIFYGPDPYQSIALFRPTRPSGAVLAFIHGGGWTNGYKEMMGYMAPAFTDRGVLFASIGYRLAPHDSHGRPASTTRGRHRLAVPQRVRPRRRSARIVVGGRSAGGHLSSLLAVRRDWQATVDFRPTWCAVASRSQASICSAKARACPSARNSWALPEQTNDVAASPLRHIQGTPPPFFMSWGERDFPHLVRQAEAMAAALRAAGASVETRTAGLRPSWHERADGRSEQPVDEIRPRFFKRALACRAPFLELQTWGLDCEISLSPQIAVVIRVQRHTGGVQVKFLD